MPTEFTVAGTKAYFSAYSPTAGVELWVTDGTAAGTVMVKDINPGLAAAIRPAWSRSAAISISSPTTA